ncbi:MAG: hypothetical protein JEZ14_10075 [Marinilabiliaceae bacterium]|nr:hypothetical protein [Marinilabiliaceae bacterium]
MIIYTDTKLVRPEHEKHTLILHLEYETSQIGEVVGKFDSYQEHILVAAAPEKATKPSCEFSLKGEQLNNRIRREIVFNYDSSKADPEDVKVNFELTLTGSDDDEESIVLSARLHF